MLLEKMEITATYLGTVSNKAITIDGENWGDIAEWKNKYDTAIENLLAN